MKTWSTVLMLTVFVLTLALSAAYAEQTTPPVSQPLIREGTLAVSLAAALKVGTPVNETEAESMLSAAGISPANGWIADYPVTPDIVGELQSSVSWAAESGKIGMGKDDALQSLQGVLSEHSLTITPDTSSGVSGAASGAEYPDSALMNDYYYDEGPPVVSYYAPPPDYSYLYSWVPYPFWWWGSWFPGFFVLSDFNGYHNGYYHNHNGHGHYGWHGKGGEHFSNHFRDPGTGAVSRVDPANRARGGTFANAGSGWSSGSAQNGAQRIFNRSTGTRATTRTNVSPVSPSSPSWNRRGSSMPSRSSGSISSGTRGALQGISPARTYNVSSGYSGGIPAASPGSSRSVSVPYSGGRSSFSSSSFTGRSFSAGRSFGSFGGGMQSFAGSRASFGGGGRR